jgi:hypothetical protein
VHRRVSDRGAVFFTGVGQTIKNKSSAGYVGVTTIRVFLRMMHLGNTIQIDLSQCRLPAEATELQMLVGDLD